MKAATRLGRWALPLIMGLLVVVAMGVLWYGRQPRGDDTPPERTVPELKQPPVDRPPRPPEARGSRRSGRPQGRFRGMYGPGMLPSQRDLDQQQCVQRVARLGGALLMYAMDYDDRLPPAGRWADRTFQYVQLEEYFQCPTLKDGYGFAYHSNLDRARPSRLPIPARTILLFESSAQARNATDAEESLCNPPRHQIGNSVVYLDGHAASTPAGRPR
ncbi:MAG: hypothetical protein FJX74_10105 [Armatimonadetes bacterium]|nr:hypothetical protein [Armatimonadota bacterium]